MEEKNFWIFFRWNPSPLWWLWMTMVTIPNSLIVHEYFCFHNHFTQQQQKTMKNKWIKWQNLKKFFFCFHIIYTQQQQILFIWKFFFSTFFCCCCSVSVFFSWLFRIVYVCVCCRKNRLITRLKLDSLFY